MLNSIPILGWAIDLIVRISLAIPFWFFWTVCGVGERYFYFAPEVYRSIPFWYCVGLFSCLGILKVLLVPKLATVDQTVNK